VVSQLVYIVFQASIGLSHAASISVSGEVAVGRFDAAVRVSRLALIHGAVVMAMVAVVYLVAPGVVLRPFLDPADSSAIAIATSLLMIAALMQFFDCAQNIGVGLLRGLDDTKSGFRLTVIGYWLIGLPAAGIFGLGSGAGPVGVWLGLMCGLAATAALLLRRFASTLAQRRWQATNAPGLPGQPPRPCRQ
jgi:multidrug resistance protein, MATE family